MIEYEVVNTAQDAMRVAFTGRLDSAGVEQAEAPVTATVRGGARHVLFDLSKVPFIGSLGIRMLISMARNLQKQGRQFVLFGVQPQVMEVFDTVALGDLIPIVGNETEALAQVAG